MDARILKIASRILRDIRVELTDEFDRNFERQAFFSEAWARSKSPTRQDGHILVNTGQLRRSITSRVTEKSVIFSSDLPYAAIHNEGGEIVVTAKMKRYFWARYCAAAGRFFARQSVASNENGRRKDGSLRQDKRNSRLADEAEFWKFMALKKAGSTIVIPRRRFLGTSPEVEAAVRRIIEDNLNEYLRDINNYTKKQ